MLIELAQTQNLRLAQALPASQRLAHRGRGGVSMPPWSGEWLSLGCSCRSWRLWKQTRSSSLTCCPPAEHARGTQVQRASLRGGVPAAGEMLSGAHAWCGGAAGAQQTLLSTWMHLSLGGQEDGVSLQGALCPGLCQEGLLSPAALFIDPGTLWARRAHRSLVWLVSSQRK